MQRRLSYDAQDERGAKNIGIFLRMSKQKRQSMLPIDKKIRNTILLLLLFTSSSLLILPSNAAQEEPYQLRCSISFNPSSPHQTETMIISAEIENLGNTPFSGQATLDVETDKQHTFEPEVAQIENLGAGETQTFDSSYRVDDEGIWWATLTIEETESSDIKLYVGSDLQQEGASVQFTDSVFVTSLADYNQQQAIRWTEIGVIISVIVAVISIIGLIKRRKDR
jgi:hypothetical protein